MNLPLPWTHSAHGTWYAVVLMVASAAAVLAYFRAKKWY